MTEMTANLLRAEPELSKQWKSDNPLARLSQPWEYKGPSLFLASDASSFVRPILFLFTHWWRD